MFERFTDRARKVMALANCLNHNYIGCDHLLLGLLKLEEGVAWEALTELGLKYERVREEVKKMSP